MATPSGATQAQGTTFEVQDSGGTYQLIGEIQTLSESGNNTAVLDASALEHTFEQLQKSRLIRKGDITGTCNLLPSDSGQSRMNTLSDEATTGQFRIVFPAPLSETWTFPGLVLSWSLSSVSVDEIITAEFTIRQTEENTTKT